MDLVLHIGAHRTGSTLIEQAISATIAAHPDCGVAIWPPQRLRDMAGFKAAARHFDEEAEPLDKASAIALDDLASRMAHEVAGERNRGVQRLILSEENFIGGMRNNLGTGVFYPDVAQRLACYDSLLPLSPTQVALGVRDYGSVWTSAYHYLPQSGHKAPPPDRARGTLIKDKRGWPDVTDAVHSVWPDAQLVMWQQETLAQDVRAVCAQITGLAADQIVLPDGKVNARTGDVARRDLFSDEERKHLTHRYNRHIRRLKSGPIVWAGQGAA